MATNLQVARFWQTPFEQFLRGHVRAVHGNMHVKCEVRSFNRFEAVDCEQLTLQNLGSCDPDHASKSKTF